MGALTIALLARKGGVGRTTLTLNLAGVFAKRGADVLCLDLDGQASLTRALLGPKQTDELDPTTTVAALFSGYDVTASEIVHDTPCEGIRLIPACDALERYATPEIGDTGGLLRDIIDQIDCSVVLIDTAPNTNVQTTWEALVASHFVLSPVPPDSFGTQSIISVQRAIDDACAVNQQLSILGYVLNQVQRNSLTTAYTQMVRRIHGSQVFDTEIPLAVAFRESIAARKPIASAKPRSKAAAAIEKLADEIDARISAELERKAA